MSEPRSTTEGRIDRSYPGEPEQPNAAEVSGTSFPLLATVLAGFAITTVVQLIIGTDSGEDLSGRITAALALIMISALLFLSSTGFALNAQANNYLPFLDLSERGMKLLNVDHFEPWIKRVAGRWKRFYSAAVFFFFLGVIMLLGGVNLIVWEFAGAFLAMALLAAIIANVTLIGVLTRILNREAPGQPGSNDDDPSGIDRHEGT